MAYSPSTIVDPTHISPSIVNNGYAQANVPPYPQQNLPTAPNQSQPVPTIHTEILTTVTSKLKVFCIISGVIYILWCVALAGIEIYITVETHWTLYRNVWTTCLIITAGIFLLTVPCHLHYSMMVLVRAHAIALFFSLLGLILTTVNLVTSTKCKVRSYSYKYICDQELITILKWCNMGIYVAISVQSIINIIVCAHIRKKTLSKAADANIYIQ